MAAYSGVRVLDCTRGIAGSTAAMHLADLGSDVVKVESAEDSRAAADAGYLFWNRNKRLTSLTLGDSHDVLELRRLLGRADVAIFDWSAAELERFGLDSSSFQGDYPGAIHAWMPPYSRFGRWADLPDVPALLAAVSGVADFHRATEERPVLPVVPILAYTQGALGAAAIGAALVCRQRRGAAQPVVVTGLHAVAAQQAAVIVDAPGITAPGMSKVGVASLANYAPYRCADGQWLFLGALTEAFFVGALDVVDLIEVMTMPGVEGSFANILRPEISAAVLPKMQERFGEKDRATWLEALDRAGIPVAPISTRDEWFGSETVVANGLRVDVHHPVHGLVAMPNVAFELSATPAEVRHLPEESYRVEALECWDDAEEPVERCIFEGPDGHLPLEGLRVLDASSFVAGTFGPSILASYGASVIKLEPPTGDPYRAFSGSFAVINQAKKGIVLDITDPAGRATLDDLLRASDVFVENLRPTSRRRLGLDGPSTGAAFPGLIHCSVGAYGRGPLADRPGFDPLLQARSGLMSAQGGADGPAMSSMLVHDIAAGSLAAVAILAAVYHRGTTGAGQHVDTSLAHASVMVQAGELTSFAGRSPALIGGRDWAGPSPYRHLYRCSDGWVCVWAESDDEVLRLQKCLELAAGGAAETAVSEMATRMRELPVAAVVDQVGLAGVAVAKVLSRFDVFVDSWLAQNSVFHPIPDADVGAYFGVRAVTDWPECKDSPPARSFRIGEDTDAILTELGTAPTPVTELDMSTATTGARGEVV